MTTSDSLTPTVRTLLSEYTTVVSRPIHWGDMDSFGHLNNVNYFRYLETARVEYVDAVGFMRYDSSQPVGPILASISCDYLAQVVYPDTLHVGVRTASMGTKSMTLDLLVVSDSSMQPVARAEAVVVAFDYDTQATIPIPDEVRRAIAALERGGTVP